MSKLPINRHFDCMKRCQRAKHGIPDCDFKLQPCEMLAEIERGAADRRGTYSGQRRQLSDRRQRDTVRLSINVSPSHLPALEKYFLFLQAALDRGINKLRHSAGRGSIEAINGCADMRSAQRYIENLLAVAAVAREHQFSNEPKEGNDHGKSKG